MVLTDQEIIDAANGADFESMVTADDYIYVIARAIEQAVLQSAQWQPIKTAPRDGTHVLLLGAKGRAADGKWIPRYGTWTWPYTLDNPTHWMPLPPPPGEQT